MGFQHLLSNFLNRMKFSRFSKRLFKRRQRGYIIIILCIFIPIICLGTKWCLDKMTLDKLKVEVGNGKGDIVESDPFKKCAKEAALEVAKKWNPALSYNDQKASMLRIADEIYNASDVFMISTLVSGSPLRRAIPALDIGTKVSVKKGKGFDPITVTLSKNDSLDSEDSEQKFTGNRIVEYINDSGQHIRGCIWNGSIVYRQAYYLKKNPGATLEVPFCDVIPQVTYYNKGSKSNHNTAEEKRTDYPSTQCCIICDKFYANDADEASPDPEGIDKIPEYYRVRKDADDPKVQISVVDDKIMVKTDTDSKEEHEETIGYAIPAECNVDIVLTIPTNAAACNSNNCDINSPTAETPTVPGVGDGYGSNTFKNMKKTPIYQIAQAYRVFLHENFEFTRGVNVGVIPYSGKVSLSPERAEDESNCWTENFETFTWNDDAEPYIRPLFLYGVPVPSYSWPGNNSVPAWGGYGDYGLFPVGGYGIMCRGRHKDTYAGNKIYMGDLLSTADPKGYKFKRINFCPARVKNVSIFADNFPADPQYSSDSQYSTDGSLLNGANPYFIVELNPDVTKICDLLNAVVPFEDNNNVSNFIFIPITWANNLFQTWARHDSFEAIDSEDDNEGCGHLSHSATGGNRKKALILIVNKPDWFEPDELTYIGFDNDYSEVPMIESDSIDFSVNYSDNGRKFADGTSYNGTIQGQNKILQFSSSGVSYNTDTGYYECESGSVTLKFPKKTLMKIVVAPSAKEDITWENKDCDLSQIGSNWYNKSSIGVGPVSDQEGECMMAQSSSGQIAYSSNGENWTSLTSTGAHSIAHLGGLMYGKGVWVSCSNYGNNSVDSIPRYSVDGGQTWQECSFNGSSTKWQRMTATCFAKNMFYGIAGQYGDGIVASNDGKTWEKKAYRPKETEGGFNYSQTLGYINGLWIVTWSGSQSDTYVAKDKDSLDLEWKTPEFYFLTEKTGGWVIGDLYGNAVHNGYLYMIQPKGTYIARTDGKLIDDNKLIFEKLSGFKCSNSHLNLTYYNGKFYTIGSTGTCCHIGTLHSEPGSIKFTNISPGNLTNTEEKSITGRMEFYIEPNQITQTNNGCEVKIDLKNIRLISAEITNRPYEVKMTTETVTVPKEVQKKANISLSGTTMGTGTGKVIAEARADIKLTVYPVITLEEVGNVLNDSFGGPLFYANGKYFCFNLPSLGPGITWGPDSRYTLNSSTDLKNWEYESTLPFGTGGSNQVRMTGFVYSEGKYVAIHSDGKRAVTSDLKEWETPESNSVSMIDYAYDGNNKYYRTNYGYIDTSTDGQSWKRVLTSGYGYENAIYANGRFLFTTNWLGGNDRGKIYVLPEDSISEIIFPELSETHTITDGNSITINIPANKLKDAGNKTYTLDYEIKDCRVSVAFVDPNNAKKTVIEMVEEEVTHYELVFTLPRVPSMSRAVNFDRSNSSESLLQYDVCNISTSPSQDYFSCEGLTKNNDKSRWYLPKNGELKLSISKGFIGDMFIIANAETLNMGKTKLTANGRDLYCGFGANLLFVEGLSRDGNSRLHSYDSEKSISVGDGAFFADAVGISAPVNAALYFGAKGGDAHTYEWLSNKSGNVDLNIIKDGGPTLACQKVTASAVEELKKNTNLRIYVIKFCEQEKYVSKTNNSEELNFNYNYIDACASSGNYVYRAKNEEELKNVLQTIAADIKEWADHKPAQNVTLEKVN